jgi:hypothetical protein
MPADLPDRITLLWPAAAKALVLDPNLRLDRYPEKLMALALPKDFPDLLADGGSLAQFASIELRAQGDEFGLGLL